MSTLFDWLVENEPTFRKSRLPSLYSDLTQQKGSNPDGFAANAAAWTSALNKAALAGRLSGGQKVLLRTSAQLLDDLRSPEYGVPTGLGAVIDEAFQSGKMLDMKQFVALEHSVFDKNWLPTPWTIVQWTLRQTGLVSRDSYDQSGRLRAGQIVLLDALEELTKQVNVLQDKGGDALTDRVMTRDAFSGLVAQTNIGSLSSEEIGILLKFMSRDKKMVVYNSEIVKFKSRSAAQPEALTDEDTTVANMKALIGSLNKQISNLSARVAALQNTAYSAVQSKNKATALSTLRSKKLAEKNLQTRIDTLHQLEEVFIKIEQAVDQVQVMQVMQSSADTLRTLNQRTGGVEKVDSVMDDLREQMGLVNDVSNVVQEPIDENSIIDEAEVDKELEALEKEQATREQEAQAEATKAKLAALDGFQAKARAQAKESEALEDSLEDSLEDELESASQRLERIRLENDGATGSASTGGAQLEAA